MEEFKSHKITLKGTLGVTAINVKTVEDVEAAVQQIIPADYSKVSTRKGEYGIIETHETESGEYRYILEYDGKNPYCATIFDKNYEILGYVKITDEEIDEVDENYEKAQKKVVIIDGKLYGYETVVKERKVNCTLGRRVSKSVKFENRVEITKEEAEEILSEYGFTVDSYISYKNSKNAENSVANAEKSVETVAVEPLKKLNRNERKAAKGIIEQAINAGSFYSYEKEVAGLVIEMIERWKNYGSDNVQVKASDVANSLESKYGYRNVIGFMRGVQINYFDYDFTVATTLGLDTFTYNTNAIDTLAIMILKKIFGAAEKLEYLYPRVLKLCRIVYLREFLNQPCHQW